MLPPARRPRPGIPKSAAFSRSGAAAGVATTISQKVDC